MGNIIGEPFRDYVDSQIKKRQLIHGKKNRSITEISYLNSTNAWAKLTSSVSLSQERLNLLKTSYGNPLVDNTIPGKDLAMNNVLFNGLTSVGNSYLGKDGKEKTSYRQVQRTKFLGKTQGAYGVGGNEFGIVPMPGIVSVDSKDLNRGSIKRSQVKIKAYNKHQFDLIDILYLRLGYTVFLEFGNNQYWDDKTNRLTKQRSTLIDTDFFKTNDNYYSLLEKMALKRKQTRGNYEAILGKIVNFSWTFTPEGTYDITLDIISIGDVIESLKINLPPIQSIGDPTKYANRQAALQNFKTSIAEDKEDFYTIYPQLKNQLKTWYDNTLNASTDNSINVKYYLTNDYDPGISVLTNQSFQYNINRVEDVVDAYGAIDILNFPQSTEETVLARDNVNKNIIDAIRFAIILPINGSYGGEYFTPSFYNKDQDNDPYYTQNFQNEVFYQYEYTRTGKTSNFRGIFDTEQYTILNSVGGSKSFYGQGSNSSNSRTDKPGRLKYYNKSAFGVDDDEVSLEDIENNYLKAQKVLFLNLDDRGGGFEGFETRIIQWFKWANAAGGAKDNQFKDNPEFASFNQELEYEKNKNRIYEWLYRVRKYYTGISDSDAEIQGGNVQPQKKYDENFGYIRFNEKRIGLVLNPYEASKRRLDPGITDPLTAPQAASLTNDYRKSLVKRWLEKVKFPNYSDSYGNIDFFVLDKISKDKEGYGDFNLSDRFRFFIRLKTLLEFLEEKVIPGIISSENEALSTSNQKIPLIKIDTDSNSNICYAIDNMVSSDIRTCLIRNDNFYTGAGNIKIFNGTPGIDYFFNNNVSDYIFGKPMNVYLNFEFVQTTLDSVTSVGEASLYEFLSKICDGINRSLGFVNNLEPIIDQETNTIRIIDQTPIPGIDQIAAALRDDDGNKVYPNFSKKNQTALEVFGYNPSNNQSNFVHKLGLTTSISKRYASMITIGATANGSVPGMEATAFSRWNKGVTDRIKPEIVDGGQDLVSFQEATIEAQNRQTRNNYIQFISMNGEQERFKILGLSEKGEINEIYVKNNPPIIENFYKYAQAKSSQTGSLESSVGFLPFNLQIDMEGISGMKIYQKVKVNTRFLPSNYPETLDFIITGVNHKLQNNAWSTTLSTQATSISKKQQNVEGINTAEYLIQTAKEFEKTKKKPFSFSNTEERFLPYIPEGYKTSYTFPFTNTYWDGFGDTGKPLTYKDAAQYLNSTHPNIGRSVFAILIAETRKNSKRTAFLQPGGNNFSGVQTDVGVWSGTSKNGLSGPITGQYGRTDSGGDLRAFAMFDTQEKFLDFMANRLTGKKFPKGDNANGWTERYLNSWVFLDLKSKNLKKYNELFPKKKAIYQTANRIYNKNI